MASAAVFSNINNSFFDLKLVALITLWRDVKHFHPEEQKIAHLAKEDSSYNVTLLDNIEIDSDNFEFASGNDPDCDVLGEKAAETHVEVESNTLNNVIEDAGGNIAVANMSGLMQETVVHKHDSSESKDTGLPIISEASDISHQYLLSGNAVLQKAYSAIWWLLRWELLWHYNIYIIVFQKQTFIYWGKFLKIF